MRITFTSISIPFHKDCRCSKCKKRVRRSKRLWQTLNPWNKNADGSVKTRDEIMAELRRAGHKWLSEPEICRACSEREGA